MAKKASRAQLQKLADKVNAHYGESAEFGARVNDQWFDDRLIVGWEGGPEDWPQSEAVAAMAPAGWFVEPVNHWAIAMYPA